MFMKMSIACHEKTNTRGREKLSALLMDTYGAYMMALVMKTPSFTANWQFPPSFSVI